MSCTYVYLFVCLYMCCSKRESQMDMQLLGNKSHQWHQCSAVIWWRGVGEGARADQLWSQAQKWSSHLQLFQLCFCRGSDMPLACMHGHTRAGIRAHVEAHTFTPKQRGAAFLKRMGLFNRGLRKGGVCADYKVMWKKCAELQRQKCHYSFLDLSCF